MPDFHRYHRQMLLPGFGEQGQRRLSEAHALVVGCGALGSCIVDSLARAGVGTLTIVDRDVVEITNLQRQVLYTQSDVAAAMPKAEAAKAKVHRINSEVTVFAHVDDFNASNAERYADGADIIMDGLDNFETRYLLNDLAVSRGLPYVYGGAVGMTGVSMTVLPHAASRTSAAPSCVTWTDEQSTPCMRCVFPEAPPPGTTPTCDTAGVLGPLVLLVAAHQSIQALKLLTGNLAAVDRSLLSIDAWSNQTRSFDMTAARLSDCPCCGRGEFEFLRGRSASMSTSLCGRNAVQITPPGDAELKLADFAARLQPHGEFTCNRFMLRGSFAHERTAGGEPIELTLFPNGRAIIKGLSEPDAARSLYARYIGS